MRGRCARRGGARAPRGGKARTAPVTPSCFVHETRLEPRVHDTFRRSGDDPRVRVSLVRAGSHNRARGRPAPRRARLRWCRSSVAPSSPRAPSEVLSHPRVRGPLFSAPPLRCPPPPERSNAEAMPGKAKRARPGETSTIPVKKRAPARAPGVPRLARGGRGASRVDGPAGWRRRTRRKRRGVVFEGAPRRADDALRRREDFAERRRAAPRKRRAASSPRSHAARRIARECLLRGDLPRAAAAAALLLSAARAPAAGARAAAAAAAASLGATRATPTRSGAASTPRPSVRLWRSPRSARVCPRYRARGAALGPDASRTTPPSTLSRGRLSATPFASPRPGSRAAASSALAAVAACFAPADEVRARELARESARGARRTTRPTCWSWSRRT